MTTTSPPQIAVGCEPDEVALKNFFLGPQAENGPWLASVISEMLENWFQWRQQIFPEDGRAISQTDQDNPQFLGRREIFEEELRELQSRFEAEMPKFSPRYIAHMFSETSLPALLGHILTLLHNPNNISGESSRVGVKVEDEAITFLAQMLGMKDDEGFGHFTSGGTLANIEGILRARKRLDYWLSMGAFMRYNGQSDYNLFQSAHLGWKAFDAIKETYSLTSSKLSEFSILAQNPFRVASQYAALFGTPYLGPVALIPDNKHYSWQKAVSLLGLGEEAFWPVDTDENGKLKVCHLKTRIEEARRQQRPIVAVISVAGTTELGELDPIHDVQALLDDYAANDDIHIWHHVDAAYGGFFCSLLRDAPDRDSIPLSQENQQALQAISRVNSVTLDPHKLGYVPYASGTFLTRLKREYFLMSIDAPYLDLRPAQDKGPQTIEGSRSAAGAVATWLTAKSIGLNANGYGRILERTIRSREVFEKMLREQIADVHIAPGCETNVLCFCIAQKGELLTETNARTQRIFKEFSPHANNIFVVSKTSLSWSNYKNYLNGFTAQWQADIDRDHLILIRLCLMNPFISSKEMAVDFPQSFARALREFL